MPRKYHYKHMAEACAKAWDEYVRIIPHEKRGNMVQAYYDIFEHKPENDAERDLQKRAAIAFARWEGTVSNFNHPVGKDGKVDLGKFADPDFALYFARIEAKYMKDGCYLSSDGTAPTPGGSDYILENLHKIADQHIPMYITHGANDQDCRPSDAANLKKAYEGLGGKVTLVNPDRTGHSITERGNALAVIDFMKNLPPRTQLAAPSAQPGHPRDLRHHA